MADALARLKPRCSPLCSQSPWDWSYCLWQDSIRVSERQIFPCICPNVWFDHVCSFILFLFVFCFSLVWTMNTCWNGLSYFINSEFSKIESHFRSLSSMLYNSWRLVFILVKEGDIYCCRNYISTSLQN